MSLFQQLKTILNDDYKEFDSVNNFNLTEPLNTTGCRQVGIQVQCPEVIVYRLDLVKTYSSCGHVIEKFPFFNNGIPKRICDYLIFYEKNSILYSFLFELKSDSIDGAKNQLNSGFHLAQYFVSTARRCSPVIINQKVKYRAILFSTRNVYKTNPSDPFFSDAGEVKYREVLCNSSYSLDSFCH